MRNPRAARAGPAATGAYSVGTDDRLLHDAGARGQHVPTTVPRAAIAAADAITSMIWRMAAQGRSAEAITARAHDMNRGYREPFAAEDVDGKIEHILATISDNAGASS